jgi:enoyl-CoA hydratase
MNPSPSPSHDLPRPDAKARLERDGELGILTVCDPPLNLFGHALLADLVTALDRAAEADLRGLLVRAEGDVFSGGADVHIFEGLGPDGAAAMRLTETVVHRLEALPYPTLGSVHGLCLTAGFELVLGCDMIWAAESARFGLVESVVGVTPLMGGTQRVAERAGPARARELVMTGSLYEAATLERWNVINRVLPDGELAERSLRFARRLAAGPTRAHAGTKRVVRAYLDHGMARADETVADVAANVAGTEDFRAGVSTFLAEGPGKATFRGR